MTIRHDFAIEALVDFPDDVLQATEPVTAMHIDTMMRRLVECGVRRLSWAVYGDGHGGFLIPEYHQYENLARTYQELEQNPLKAAVQAAHRHGLEIYGYFKPYETGASGLFPEGSYEAAVYGRLSQLGGRMTWLDPFVADHPALRIRRRMDDLSPDIQRVPICRLKLRKRNDAPTRVTRLIIGNSATPSSGGGSYGGALYNCTIVSNSTGIDGAGTYSSTLSNCISWYNNDYQPTAYYSCGVGYTNGGSISGNITNNPLFADYAAGNYRLTGLSPCVDAGINQDWMTNGVDLDGLSRLDRYSAIVDMGCYEYVPPLRGTILTIR